LVLGDGPGLFLIDVTRHDPAATRSGLAAVQEISQTVVGRHLEILLAIRTKRTDNTIALKAESLEDLRNGAVVLLERSGV
jgi:hypothetical protein